MKIAIDVADLDCERIDGTRVYIQNVLKYLGKLAPEDEFFLFHKTEYNKLLRPAEFENYHDKSLGKGLWWTQIKFARVVRKLKPGVCWMPIQQIPGLNFQFSIFNFQSIFNSLIFKFKLVFSGGKVKFRKANVGSDLKTPQNSHSSNFDPLYTGGGTRYVVTIHDLAFKRELFPDHFPLIDRLKINFYTNVAVNRADKIIAISEATKKDLIKFYPKIDEKKIVVVRHGFDRENFEQEFSDEEKEEFLKKWGIIESKVETGHSPVKSQKLDVNIFNDKGSNLKTPHPPFRERWDDPLCTGGGNYLLYVGAIQPRKDLVTLIRAFNKIKSRGTVNREQRIKNSEQGTVNSEQDISGDVSGLKLILVGEKAWKSEGTLREIDKSEFKDDIIVTGKVDFKELAMFYCLAKVFVFPSLYEGFGIPVLEAMASKAPVIVADNSSLSEVGGEAVLKFRTGDSSDLEKQLRKLLGNERLREEMVEKGLERVKEFSWERCAEETLEVLRGI